MESGIRCFHATIDEIEPGMVFAVSIGEVTTFCFSIESVREGHFPALLALSPGHPMLRNRVGVLDSSVVSGRPLLVYPEARFVPSPRPDHLFFNWFRNPPIGSLALRGSQFAIIAETGQGPYFYGCEKGERLGISWQGESKVAFLSWEVMIEGPGGEPYTLCVINTEQYALASS